MCWRTKRSDLRWLVLKERKIDTLTLCGAGVRNELEKAGSLGTDEPRAR